MATRNDRMLTLSKTVFRIALHCAISLCGATYFAVVAAHPVVGISDGDTLTLLVDQKPVKIRLANIDAPESKQAWGSRSKQHLSALCYRKDATYTAHETDRYGRVVALVVCDGVEANRAQVAHGMAWVYRKYNRDQSFLALERDARELRRGLWSDPDPVPPWEWRAQAKGNNR